MITWILATALLTWVLVRRFSRDGKIKGEPLGMPRGTVRALITLMIVSFPFGYLLAGQNIPPLIVNAIFIVVAFYFEARREVHEELKQIVSEIKSSDLTTTKPKKKKKPLYLPKYTVRISLVVILILIQIIIYFQPSVIFQTTNTLAEVLIIVALFIIGALFRLIIKTREKKNTKEQVQEMDASLTDVQIIEKLILREPSRWKSIGKSIFSIIMLILVTAALLLYTFNIDYVLLALPQYTFTLRGFLLLLVNVYYGLRD